MAGERILIVDDNPRIREILTHIFDSAGYSPQTTGDPDEALRWARKDPPDVALLDVMMPTLDGFDLCQMLQDHMETRSIPVVFVTALGDDINQARGRVSGGIAHVQKPFRKEDVLAAVQTALEGRPPKSQRSGNGWAKAISLSKLKEDVQGSSDH